MKSPDDKPRIKPDTSNMNLTHKSPWDVKCCPGFHYFPEDPDLGTKCDCASWTYGEFVKANTRHTCSTLMEVWQDNWIDCPICGGLLDPKKNTVYHIVHEQM